MQGNLSGEARERLQVIDQSLQRAGRKLCSLLLIAQPGGQKQLISLAQMMDDLLALVHFQIVMDKVLLKSDLDAQCRWEGMAGELARAVLYVLNNAIEAVAGRPNPVISVVVERNVSQNSIRISNNGLAIPEAVRARIFEPFFSTKGGRHNGVGLYLANEIVSAAGGAIELIESGEGQTTAFAIQLPANVHD